MTMTLRQLSNFMWYIQTIRVLDVDGNILFEGENYQLSSVNNNDICNKIVCGFGANYNTLVVTVK